MGLEPGMGWFGHCRTNQRATGLYVCTPAEALHVQRQELKLTVKVAGERHEEPVPGQTSLPRPARLVVRFVVYPLCRILGSRLVEDFFVCDCLIRRGPKVLPRFETGDGMGRREERFRRRELGLSFS